MQIFILVMITLSALLTLVGHLVARFHSRVLGDKFMYAALIVLGNAMLAPFYVYMTLWIGGKLP
jgi:hypothetical protein